MLHLVSILLLVLKLRKSKSCVGISCKMQEMYAMVFIFRYVDLFWLYVSLYNTVMKVVFITLTLYLVYTMKFKSGPVRQTYDATADNFNYVRWLLPPCFVLTLITTADYSIVEVLWTMSIWMESVAILPQLSLLQRQREVENLTSNFVFAMGAYRGFYIINWIYRYFAEGYVNWVGWIGGGIQVALYCDFFYYFAMSKWYGQKLILPMAE
ncbi:endoplasmic reticulum retention receptor, putative [Perkinsus marinus ATCC 50983]|uniref:Endoplasmic reticulum retention receptor, putative n=1 Tax=Perkinsus marinus (strain ATCC 50983 / TXsc) TaxID=423536 RepID=C5LAL2_PERM5|nr:endoplasmic reticulum retention receptor, putative [Perkinsus marinus ATCC 50983]EER06468.1 endoplasmic reticulum retention receptor, putative [Perkinsus marinus ATCC 50983]|eukprot:XP_002774652.1 endoplasmic reticulum retention receptor, putative [Perkinsus marinus ATCC 50983]